MKIIVIEVGLDMFSGPLVTVGHILFSLDYNKG